MSAVILSNIYRADGTFIIEFTSLRRNKSINMISEEICKNEDLNIDFSNGNNELQEISICIIFIKMGSVISDLISP